MSKYKIIQVIDTLKAGGSERMAVNIYNAIEKDNFYHSYLCATRENGALSNHAVNKNNIFILNKRYFFDFKVFIKFYNIIKYNKISIIHAHSSSIFWAILQKLFFKNLKVIWHDHRGTKKVNKSLALSLAFISFFIDGVISVNDNLLDWSRKNLFVSNKKIIRINNFPELDFSEINFKKIKSKYDKINILCLANLRPQKNHLMLIEAINILVNILGVKNINVNLAGVIYYDDYYNSIINKIKFYKLNKYINLLGPLDDTKNILLDSDIGILSSKSEGLPVCLLEYGIAKLPTISSNVGQCSEVLNKGKAGILINNAKELAEAIKEFINDESLRKMYSENIFEHVNANFTGVKFIRDYKNFLKKI